MSDVLPAPWRVCVDTGGTFTDCIAIAPTGDVRRAKVLSSGCIRAQVLETSGHNMVIRGTSRAEIPSFDGFTVRLTNGWTSVVVASEYDAFDAQKVFLRLFQKPRAHPASCDLLTGEPAPILAARLATSTPLGSPFPPLELRLATTRGTNALLERRAAPAALFLTAGFKDLLRIGTQQRPDLFALAPRKPENLPCEIIEVHARFDAHGRELHPLDLTHLRDHARALVARGITSAGIALLHAWKTPDHERKLAAFLRDCGFAHISTSSDLAPALGYLSRAQTTLVNAYLAPIVDAFISDVAQGLHNASGPSRLLLMSSAAGLTPAHDFRPKDSLLSGPAGGVLGALDAARRSGFTRVLAFDMGGTSTDVARLDNAIDYVYEHRVGPGSIMAPAVSVESVAAGGGSVCWFDAVAGLLRVGPHSAGATPGPACYGAGGPLTVTDVNLLLERMDPARVQLPLNPGASRAAANALLQQVRASGRELSLRELLDALIAIANEQMAAAMRTVSVQRGYDPGDYAMVAFGGAGGQHACAVAALLGINTIIIPPDVGLLSARGLLSASVERFASRQVLRPLADTLIDALLTELAAEALAQLRHDGYAGAEVSRQLLSVRLQGQDAAIQIDVPPAAPDPQAHTRAEFARLFQQLYGYTPVQRTLELESARVIVRATLDTPQLTTSPPNAAAAEPRELHVTATDRAALAPGDRLLAPALITEPHATTVLDPGWSAEVDAAGALILRRSAHSPAPAAHTRTGARELLAARLTSVATDMGETLRRTALSTNVKDRLDFSCAVLDANAELVVNAPHIPVHLGALGLCVRLVAAALPLAEHDVVVTNHPAFGGSHLPDVTVIAPVFHEGRLLAYVASRAHHAEIGGTRPGSMPPGARTLAEEGVVIPPTFLIHRGESRLSEFRDLLLSAPHPTRAPDENLADVQAQLAACRRGQQGVLALAREFGTTLSQVMDDLRGHSESRVRAALDRAVTRPLHAREVLDDGSIINVAITRDSNLPNTTTIDFTGTSDTHPFNLNAPLGVLRSAVMYVLRLLVNEPLPLNEGLLRAVNLRVPPGMLNPEFPPDPSRCPAVAGGNVETSQRVVDTLLKAFNLAACSQGTMNNVVFGNSRFGYYETVCGGAGATPSADGESAVHTHMTNTRITDPEVLETRYPVRLNRFELRPGSGGHGRRRGGDGITREITFLEPVSLSLLTQHRTHPPYGADSGLPGQPGAQTLTHPDGHTQPLPSAAALEAPAGSTLTLHTPGGGGWGDPTQAR